MPIHSVITRGAVALILYRFIAYLTSTLYVESFRILSVRPNVGRNVNSMKLDMIDDFSSSSTIYPPAIVRSNIQPDIYQRDAIISKDPAVMIVAGPGSGKTRVLAARLAYLLQTDKCKPSECLVISFTSSAALNLLKKTKELCDKGSVGKIISTDDVFCDTFHGFCSTVMKEHIHLIALNTNNKGVFNIANDDDQIRIMMDLMEIKGLNPLKAEVHNILATIRYWKELGLGYTGVRKNSLSSETEKRAYELYPIYQSKLKVLHKFDFGDLLLYTLRLFKSHPDILDQYRSRFRHVLVDEFQDVSPAQYDILRLLILGTSSAGSEAAGGGSEYAPEQGGVIRFSGREKDNRNKNKNIIESNNSNNNNNNNNNIISYNNYSTRKTHHIVNVFCAGDDDQSIYGYRGAKVELMQRFRFDFPGSRTVKFGTSYRLPEDLCKATQVVISSSNIERISKSLISSKINIPMIYNSDSRGVSDITGSSSTGGGGGGSSGSRFSSSEVISVTGVNSMNNLGSLRVNSDSSNDNRDLSKYDSSCNKLNITEIRIGSDSIFEINSIGRNKYPVDIDIDNVMNKKDLLRNINVENIKEKNRESNKENDKLIDRQTDKQNDKQNNSDINTTNEVTKNIKKRAAIEIRCMEEENDEMNWIVYYLQEKIKEFINSKKNYIKNENKSIKYNNNNNVHNNNKNDIDHNLSNNLVTNNDNNRDTNNKNIIHNNNNNNNNNDINDNSDYSIVILTRYPQQLKLIQEKLKGNKIRFLSRNSGSWKHQNDPQCTAPLNLLRLIAHPQDDSVFQAALDNDIVRSLLNDRNEISSVIIPTLQEIIKNHQENHQKDIQNNQNNNSQNNNGNSNGNNSDSNKFHNNEADSYKPLSYMDAITEGLLTNKFTPLHYNALSLFLQKFKGWCSDQQKYYKKGDNTQRILNDILQAAYFIKWNEIGNSVNKVIGSASKYASLTLFLEAIGHEDDFIEENNYRKFESSENFEQSQENEMNDVRYNSIENNQNNHQNNNQNNQDTNQIIFNTNQNNQLLNLNSQYQIMPTLNIWAMNMHASKGLEFHEVILPFWSKDTEADSYEANERKIAFVSLTRAKKRVMISYSDTKKINEMQVVKTGRSNLVNVLLSIPDIDVTHNRIINNLKDNVKNNNKNDDKNNDDNDEKNNNKNDEIKKENSKNDKIKYDDMTSKSTNTINYTPNNSYNNRKLKPTKPSTQYLGTAGNVLKASRHSSEVLLSMSSDTPSIPSYTPLSIPLSISSSGINNNDSNSKKFHPMLGKELKDIMEKSKSSGSFKPIKDSIVMPVNDVNSTSGDITISIPVVLDSGSRSSGNGGSAGGGGDISSSSRTSISKSDSSSSSSIDRDSDASGYIDSNYHTSDNNYNNDNYRNDFKYERKNTRISHKIIPIPNNSHASNSPPPTPITINNDYLKNKKELFIKKNSNLISNNHVINSIITEKIIIKTVKDIKLNENKILSLFPSIDRINTNDIRSYMFYNTYRKGDLVVLFKCILKQRFQILSGAVPLYDADNNTVDNNIDNRNNNDSSNDINNNCNHSNNNNFSNNSNSDVKNDGNNNNNNNNNNSNKNDMNNKKVTRAISKCSSTQLGQHLIVLMNEQ